MSLLSLAKQGVKVLGSKSKNVATGLAQAGARIVQETGQIGQGITNTLNKGYTAVTGNAPTIPLGSKDSIFQAGSPAANKLDAFITPKNTDQKIASNVGYYGSMVSPKSVLSGVRSLGTTGLNTIRGAVAPKVASLADNFARAEQSLASKTLDMRAPNAPSSRAPKPTPEVKTTNARNSTLDTSPSPTKTGTVKTRVTPEAPIVPPRKFPIAKTALGVAGTGLVGSALMGGENGQPTSLDGGMSMAPAPTAAASTEALSPDAVWGTGYEGGAFESPAPAAPSGTEFGVGGSLQPSVASIASGGAGTASGLTGSGGYPNMSPKEEYIKEDDEKDMRGGKKRQARQDDARARHDARVAELEMWGGKENKQAYDNVVAQEKSLNRTIENLINKQASYDIDLETSAASSSAREGLAGNLDRETRKSLIPLQTALAGVQKQRERLEGVRKENATKTAEQDKLYTLGEGQNLFDGQGNKIASGGVKVTPENVDGKIEQYNFAKTNGYTGSFTEFLNVTDEDGGNGMEYFNLGGTRYAQDANGNIVPVLKDEKLSSDASKVNAIVTTMVPEINQLKTIFESDYRGALTGYLTGTNRELVKLIDQVADKVGRLRSGGAVNRDEEERFKRQIASFMDLPFGNSTQAIAALDGLISEANEVSQGITPGQNGGTGGGTWDWGN